MAFIRLGEVGNVFRQSNPLVTSTEHTFKRVVYFEEDAVFSSGASAQALVRSANFSVTNETGWGGDGAGNWWFYGTVIFGDDVTFGSDLWSSNWASGGGSVPDDLSGGANASATLGYYLDHSAGAAQFQNIYAEGGQIENLSITGALTLATGGIIRTAASGQRVELAETELDALRFYTGNVNESSAGGITISTGETMSIWGPKMSGDFFSNYIQITGGSTTPGFHFLTTNGEFRVSTWDNDIVLNTYSNNPGTANTSDIRLEAGGRVQVEFGHNTSEDFRVVDWVNSGVVRFKVASSDILFYDNGGTVKSYWDESLNLWRYATDIRIDSGNDLFTHKVHTGGTSWTQEPWSSSTIELGDYGAIGTQGSFALDLAWNYERNTSSTWSHKNVNGYAEAGGIRIKNDGISFLFDLDYSTTHSAIPTTIFRMDVATQNQSRLYGNSTTQWFEIDTTNGWFQFFIASQEQMRIDDAGSSSALRLNDGLTNVGNHEVLRLDRGSGTVMREVGYYSSYIRNPETGKREKFKVLPLSLNHRFWQREWFMDLRPIKYDRHISAAQKAGHHPWYIQRELGFSIENLSQHTELLTTKGSERGGSPDEYALLAVTIDYVQHLEQRVAALEAAQS